MEEKLAGLLITLVVTAITGAIVKLFERVKKLEIAQAGFAAQSDNSADTMDKMAHRMEKLAEDMIQLGREMSGLAAALGVLRDRHIQEMNR